MKSILKISDHTKKVLVGLFIIISISFLVAYIYYNGKNKAEDPRIVKTKYMFKQNDDLMKGNKFSSALPLLDSIESILVEVPGYKDSYELGIVYNNKGSAYLSMALYGNKDSTERLRLLETAKKNIDSAIFIYSTWIEKNRALSKEELSQVVKPYFSENDLAFRGKNYNKIFHRRIEDLVLAQKETLRRLSVSFTNLGIIQRHLYKQNEAAESYIKAIQIWKENITARNNFNVLMGKPPKDRSIIDKLFPPDKNKFN